MFKHLLNTLIIEEVMLADFDYHWVMLLLCR